jgi:hypothetical protein
MSTTNVQKKEVLVVENAKATNGVENLKTAVQAKKIEDLKPIEKQEKEIVKLPIVPTAEFRLKMAEQFRILGEKFNFLKTKEDELNKFVLSSDGTKEKISLSNASGFKFEVSNSQTIEKVLKVIQDDLSAFTERANEEILNFKI